MRLEKACRWHIEAPTVIRKPWTVRENLWKPSDVKDGKR